MNMTRLKERVLWKGLLQFFLLLFCFINAGGSCQAADDGPVGKRVLFISSYSYAWDTVQLQIEGIIDGLGREITLDYEFMDTKRVDDAESMRLFREGLAYRLSKVEPYDVVILGDDAALQFALDYRAELFDGVPLVFEGINSVQLAERAVSQPLVAGVMETLSVEKNIELGLKLTPSAKEVVAIVDDTITGEAVRKSLQQEMENYPDLEYSEINASQLTSSRLKLALHNVKEDSILIYVTLSEDASGKLYTSLEAIKLITENANVPVLRMVEGGIGDGLLGGNIVSMFQSGNLAAQLALQFMSGRNANYVEKIVDSPAIYCVDAQVMDRFHINLSVLPEDTVIINQKETFFDKNREVLVPGLVLIGALIVIIGWVTFDNYRRRKLMEQLKETGSILESASQHDFLTGIPNRSKFMSDLKEQIDAKKPCTIMMIDIDNFKSINDTMGHTAGDEALQQVAGRLKEMGTDLLTPYRFAGDEFIIILKSNNAKIVEKTAYQCRQIFTKPFHLAGNERNVGGSIGIASYPKDTEDLEQLVVFADDAMYQVKKNGKNDFAFYQPPSEK